MYEVKLSWWEWLTMDSNRLREIGVKNPAEARFHATGHEKAMPVRWVKTIGLWGWSDPTLIKSAAKIPDKAHDVGDRQRRHAYGRFKFHWKLKTITDPDFIYKGNRGRRVLALDSYNYFNAAAERLTLEKKYAPGEKQPSRGAVARRVLGDSGVYGIKKRRAPDPSRGIVEATLRAQAEELGHTFRPELLGRGILPIEVILYHRCIATVRESLGLDYEEFARLGPDKQLKWIQVEEQAYDIYSPFREWVGKIWDDD